MIWFADVAMQHVSQCLCQVGLEHEDCKRLVFALMNAWPVLLLPQVLFAILVERSGGEQEVNLVLVYRRASGLGTSRPCEMECFYTVEVHDKVHPH